MYPPHMTPQHPPAGIPYMYPQPYGYPQPQQPPPARPAQPRQSRPMLRGHRGHHRQNQRAQSQSLNRPPPPANSNFPGRSSTQTRSKSSGPKNKNQQSKSKKRPASPLNKKISKKQKDEMSDGEDHSQQGSSTIADRYCILVLGGLSGYMPTRQEISDFSTAFKVKISDKVFTLNYTQYDFNLKAVKEGYVVKCCCIKFGEDWFYGLNDTIKEKFENNTLAVVDLYALVYNIIDQQVKKVQNFYKPKGPIFLISTCRVHTEAVVASYANLNGHPLIQLDEDGKQKFSDLGGDRKKVAKHFAYKIGDRLSQFANMHKTRTNMNAQVVDEEIYDPDSF